MEGENAVTTLRSAEHNRQLKQSSESSTTKTQNSINVENNNREDLEKNISNENGVEEVDLLAKNVIGKIFTRNQMLDLTEEDQQNNENLIQPSIMNGCVQMKRYILFIKYKFRITL